MYIPPFLKPYCERYEGKVWNGCWAETCARGIDWLTAGRISGLTEADIRSATGKPDHNLKSDGGTVDDQVRAIRHFVPNAQLILRPTWDELQAGLSNGQAALLAGNEHNAPSFDRPLDPHFYDEGGGHAVLVMGTPEGVLWGNPEEFLNAPPDYATLEDVIEFVWAAGQTGHLEAVLLCAQEAAMKVTFNPALKIGTLDPKSADGRIFFMRRSDGVTFESRTPGPFDVYGTVQIPNPDRTGSVVDCLVVDVAGEECLRGKNALDVYAPIAAGANLASIKARLIDFINTL